jgi:hypothetical protein
MPRLTYEMEQRLKKDLEDMHASQEQHAESTRLQHQERINAAATAIVAALLPLDPQARQRVLKAASVLLGMEEHPNG